MEGFSSLAPTSAKKRYMGAILLNSSLWIVYMNSANRHRRGVENRRYGDDAEKVRGLTLPPGQRIPLKRPANRVLPDVPGYVTTCCNLTYVL